MTYKDIADTTKINYSTVRKYVRILREKGYNPEPNEDLAEMLKNIAQQTADGVSLDNAIDDAMGIERDRTDTELIRELYKKIDDMEKTNRIQSDLLQVYLSRVNQLEDYMRKALPPPNETPWRAFLRMLGVRRKK